MKPICEIGEQKVQGTQSKNREDVCGQHDERIIGNCKNCGDRVDGKNHVRGANQNQHHEQRRVVLDAVNHHGHFFAVELRGDLHAFTQYAQNGVQRDVGLLARSQPHFETREHQKRAEHIEQPMKVREQPRAHQNQDRAQHDGTDDADDERPLLKLRRNREVTENHQEHEYIVHRQAFLHEVAGDELHRHFIGDTAPLIGVEIPPQEGHKHERERKPQQTPAHGLFGGHLVRALLFHDQ